MRVRESQVAVSLHYFVVAHGVSDVQSWKDHKTGGKHDHHAVRSVASQTDGTAYGSLIHLLLHCFLSHMYICLAKALKIINTPPNMQSIPIPSLGIS